MQNNSDKIRDAVKKTYGQVARQRPQRVQVSSA